MINAVSTNDSTAAAAAAMKKETGLNKDDFMQLLVTQLKNQDPLNPQDSSAFVAQLAQLTQVEQTYNINTNLQNILNGQNNAGNLSSVSFIGKEITAQGSQVSLTSGTPSTLGFTLPSAAAQLSVQISDANGNTVRTLTQGKTAAGANSIAWDGLNSAKQPLPSGTYSFAVSGIDASGQIIAGSTTVHGKVTGVKLDGTTPVLTVNGLDVPLTSILEVKGGSI
jgi:flagellar basal-body rod modification protein FlgD